LDGTTSYFGRLAGVPLLTREGEIEVAKRKETCEHEMLSALGDCNAGRIIVSQLGAAVLRGELGARDVVRVFDEEDPDWEDTERRRLLRHVAKVASPAASAQTVRVLVAMRLTPGAVAAQRVHELGAGVMRGDDAAERRPVAPFPVTGSLERHFPALPADRMLPRETVFEERHERRPG
jgi:hypothetical protein